MPPQPEQQAREEINRLLVAAGWRVCDLAAASRASRKELWVLAPKALPAFLAKEKAVISPEDVKLATFHLSRFIREQEREIEARK